MMTLHATQTHDSLGDALAAPDSCFAETVTEIEHYTDGLFRFRMTRPASFRFRSGEFVMIGLPGTAPVFRAYSIASPNWDDTLEFYSIKVPGGPLTERLQHIRPGDTIWMRRKPTGTLVIDALVPGRQLWMFATGTGIAPFASIIRDPESYEKFDRLILVQGCRHVAELAYARGLGASLGDDPLVGAFAAGRLQLITATTREDSAMTGRLTSCLADGRLETAADATLDPATDRAMICGSMAMLNDMREALQARGFVEGSNARPADFVIEKAFVG
tara:strand:- start:44 stop:865 length:822 start_codon:yes stop_codon:yes gene_type:complete